MGGMNSNFWKSASGVLSPLVATDIIDILKIQNTQANNDLTFENTAVDGSGHGKDILFKSSDASGTGDLNAGNYIFNLTSNIDDGETGALVLNKSGVATEADDESQGLSLYLPISAWNTDTAAAENGGFWLFAEGEDGDNSHNAYGYMSLEYFDDNNDFRFMRFSRHGIDIEYFSDATVGTQEQESIPLIFNGQAWDVDTTESQQVKYGMRVAANAAGAGENTSADMIFTNNNGSEKLRLYDDGTLKTFGGRIRGMSSLNAATYDVLPTDDIIHVVYTSTAAVTSITLPTAQMVEGRVIVIKDAGGLAGTNNITIDTEGAEGIDGQDTAVISGNYDSITIYTDSNNWYII